jgi:hypothetical protein
VIRVGVRYARPDGTEEVEWFRPMVGRTWSPVAHLVGEQVDHRHGLAARCGRMLWVTGWKDVGLANVWLRRYGVRPMRRMCRSCMTLRYTNGKVVHLPKPDDLND